MATVDARGLSCPQPVLLALGEMKKLGRGALEVYTLSLHDALLIVDTDTSVENVTRAAESLGWSVKESQPEGGGYRLVLEKS